MSLFAASELVEKMTTEVALGRDTNWQRMSFLDRHLLSLG